MVPMLFIFICIDVYFHATYGNALNVNSSRLEIYVEVKWDKPKFLIRSKLPHSLMQGGHRIEFMCLLESDCPILYGKEARAMLNDTHEVPTMFRRTQNYASTVPMVLGDKSNSFPELRCSCQSSFNSEERKLQVVGYREFYRLCNSDYDTCLLAGSCANKIKPRQLAGCVVKPGRQPETCVELTSKDCDDMHKVQGNVSATKVCAGGKEFATLCHALSNQNEDLHLVTAVVNRSEPCPPKVSYSGDLQLQRYGIYKQKREDGDYCNYGARSAWTYLHHQDVLMIDQFAELPFCFVCAKHLENVTVWFSEDTETTIQCEKKHDEEFAYATYTFGFAAITNGYIGFSAMDDKVYTEISYIVLPKYQLAVTRIGDDEVRCQLVLEVDQENIWSSNVYFLYQFKVNGEPRGDYQEHKSNPIARTAITEPGKYECECHVYFCGAYSHKNHLHHVTNSTEVGATSRMQLRRRLFVYLTVSLSVVCVCAVALVVFFMYRAYKNKQKEQKFKYLTGTEKENNSRK